MIIASTFVARRRASINRSVRAHSETGFRALVMSRSAQALPCGISGAPRGVVLQGISITLAPVCANSVMMSPMASSGLSGILPSRKGILFHSKPFAAFGVEIVFQL